MDSPLVMSEGYENRLHEKMSTRQKFMARRTVFAMTHIVILSVQTCILYCSITSFLRIRDLIGRDSIKKQRRIPMNAGAMNYLTKPSCSLTYTDTRVLSLMSHSKEPELCLHNTEH